MWLNQRKCLLIATLVVLGPFLASGGAIAQAGEKLPVFVSIPPQKYFVQQIGKERVKVEVMVPAGGDAHTYEPKPGQMIALSKARLYFAIGIQPFENIWLKRIGASHPSLRIVHTDQGIRKIPMEAHHHDEAGSDEKGEGGNLQQENSGNELDPHIWLSPPLVVILARAISNALQETDPAHRAEYESNYQAFASDLAALDADLRDMFAGQQGRQFMVFHPAWGYFAHAYGLKQVPVEIEGKDPKPAQLKALIEHARQKHIKVIFVQPQFSSRSAELVAKAIGGRVIFADPQAADWPANLREVAHKFKAALK